MKNVLTMRFFALLAATSALRELTSARLVSAQVVREREGSVPHLVLKKLSPPVYPPLARQARIAGDVSLKVVVHPDGTMESVTATSGHPLLMKAALDSAEQSQFECLECGTVDVSRTVTYSFQESQETNPDPCCCTQKPATSKNDKPAAGHVSQSEDHITIKSPPVCICPDACSVAWAEAHSKFRSPKCLYLWKCGTRLIYIQ